MLNLIGVIVAFIVVIIFIRSKFNFGFSLIIGSLIIGIFSLQIIEISDIPKAFASLNALLNNNSMVSFVV